MATATASAPAPSPAHPVFEAPSLAQGADLLAELHTTLRQRARLDAKVVSLVDELQASGTVEALEALPLDLVLALDHRMTKADRWMLETAVEVLRSMPLTMRLFRQGMLSWSQVRGIVSSARRLPVDARGILDERIAESVDLIDRLDPDQLLWMVEQAIDELRGADKVERDEQADERDEFLALQQTLWGGVEGFLRFGAVNGAILVNALDAQTARRHNAGGDKHTAAQDRAASLIDLAQDSLAGSNRNGTRRQAKPSVVVHVDLRHVTETAAGILELNLPGWLPTVSAATLESLAKTADIQAILFDGYRPLAVAQKVSASEIPADTRLAIRARDLGCRFPGSRIPLGAADLHHLDGKDAGHHPDRILTLGRYGHLNRIHRRGWSADLDPDTGEATFTTPNGRTYRTLPRGTRLRRPPPDHRGSSPTGDADGPDPPDP